ncbi:tetratricopeptide repeat protein [Arcobacter sp. LA11]|uniref:tetratricopeptide repeat protein n=1 Tax=Arcobacter sp. LA11 TaxID=1898176 RepID=UPI0009326357|nr:tetratricopeptide repeat protein [Arcobacter sp. LA11]
MKLIKILLILTLTIFFTACNDNKKEIGYEATLPMPSTKGLSNMGLIGLAHDGKKDPIPATQIGYTYSEELKDYDKAIEWYKYSNSMKPMAENSNYMCYAYQMKKEYEEALKWCKNAIELGSDEALIGLGSAYDEVNEHARAIDYYKKAYEKKLPEASNNLGYSYSKIKDYKKAEVWYKKAIKEGNLESYQNIATFYHEGLNDNIKASAYAIAVIDTKYSKSSVLRVLKEEMKIPNETIKKGYELQLNSDEFPIKYKGDLGL